MRNVRRGDWIGNDLVRLAVKRKYIVTRSGIDDRYIIVTFDLYFDDGKLN